MLLRHKDVAASLGQREGALAHPEVDDAKAFVRQLALCTAKLNEGDREILLALVGCAMTGDFDSLSPSCWTCSWGPTATASTWM